MKLPKSKRDAVRQYNAIMEACRRRFDRFLELALTVAAVVNLIAYVSTL